MSASILLKTKKNKIKIANIFFACCWKKNIKVDNKLVIKIQLEYYYRVKYHYSFIRYTISLLA